MRMLGATPPTFGLIGFASIRVAPVTSDERTQLGLPQVLRSVGDNGGIQAFTF